MHTHEDPATWTPEPIRPRWQLALRFAATVVCLPLLCALWLAAFAVLLAIGLCTEIIAIFSDRYDRAYMTFTENVLENIPRLGSWFVTWPELRHEGDAEHYQDRVDRLVELWTTRALTPHKPKKTPPPVECTISLRDYRGAGAGYVAEVARAQGWELRPSDVSKEVRLARPAAAREEGIASE